MAKEGLEVLPKSPGNTDDLDPAVYLAVQSDVGLREIIVQWPNLSDAQKRRIHDVLLEDY